MAPPPLVVCARSTFQSRSRSSRLCNCRSCCLGQVEERRFLMSHCAGSPLCGWGGSHLFILVGSGADWRTLGSAKRAGSTLSARRRERWGLQCL